MPIARSRETVLSVSTSASSSKLSIRALSLKQVVDLTNLSKAHIYLLIARGEFPQPAKIGRISICDIREVELWLEARFAAREASYSAGGA